MNAPGPFTRPATFDRGEGWSLYMGERLVLIELHANALTPASFEAYVAGLDRRLRELSRPTPSIGVLYEVDGDLTFFNAARRKRIAEMLLQHRDRLARVTAGLALVSPTTLARGIMTAIFWITRPDFPVQVAGSAPEALRWFSEIVPGLELQEATRVHARVAKTLR